MKPQRIQLRRTKGWRMPENTVKVCRPTKWGNSFKVGAPVPSTSLHFDFDFHDTNKYIHGVVVPTTEEAVRLFVKYDLPYLRPEELRGKNLACWCSLESACHADYLLKLANA